MPKQGKQMWNGAPLRALYFAEVVSSSNICTSLAGVDVGGGGEDGDGDGGQHEQPERHQPEHVAHAEAVGAVQAEHLPRHPAATPAAVGCI